MLNKKIFILVLFLHTFIQLVQSSDQNETASNMEVCVKKNGCNVNVVFTGIQNFVETFITNIVDEVVDVVMTPYSSPLNPKNDTDPREITTTTSTPRVTELIGNDKKTTFSTPIMPTTTTTATTTSTKTTTDKSNINTTSTTISPTLIVTPTDKPNINTPSTTISSTSIVTTTDYQQNSTNFLLYKTPDGLFMRPYHSKNANITAINITDSSNSSTIVSADEIYKKYKAFTIDCKNKIIYILKTSKKDEKIVDIINYDENNKFKRINQINDTFRNAQSIDWKTEKIYFTENINSSANSSIKFTDGKFNNSTLVTQSDKIKSKILVYPKQEIIIFSDFLNFFYTSTSPNSIPKTLDQFPSLIMNISDFAIDYALDKLWWITASQDGNSTLNCADIVGFNQSIALTNMSSMGRIQKHAKNLVVFDKKFYFTAEKNNKTKLYFKNATEEAGIVVNSKKADQLTFFSLNCPN